MVLMTSSKAAAKTLTKRAAERGSGRARPRRRLSRATAMCRRAGARSARRLVHADLLQRPHVSPDNTLRSLVALPPVVVSKRGEVPRPVRSSLDLPQRRHARGRACPPGAVVRVLGPTGRPLGFAFFSVAVGDPAAHGRARRHACRRPSCATGWLAARAWREDGRAGGGGLPPRPRRGRRPPVAGRGPLRRVPRRADAVAGHGSAARARSSPRSSISAPAARDPGAQRPARAHAGGAGRAGRRPARRSAGERRPSSENGVRFEADLWRGQKTGLFLDQRENHAMARELRARPRPRRVHLQRRLRPPGGGAGRRRCWPSTSPRKRWRACSATPP